MLVLKRNFVYVVGFIACCLIKPSASFAEETFIQNTFETTLNIGVSFAIPPWVITDNDSGIELEILKEAFSSAGYKVKPNYLSFSLAYSLFEAGKLDGVVNAKENILKSGFYSDPVVTFQNVAISLNNNEFPENIDISFLQDKSIIAFQKASLLLGDEFKKMTEKNSMYQEVAKQSLQINLLMIRNIDFIIMDKSIFGYYWQQAQNDPNLVRAKSKLDRPVRFHYLFEPTDYRFAFRTAKIRDDFNTGLAILKNNGRYDEIIKRYSHLSDLYSDTK